MKVQDYAVKADNVFVLPEAVTKIKQLIDDDSTSMDDIAEVINYDPAIMSQVLKISNSALYKFPSTITTVSKAIQVIGTRSVYDLVLAYGVAYAFKDLNKDVIDLDKFWELGVNCALLAKYFAEEIGIKEPEKLFVCGLLHNIGELVFVQVAPNLAQKNTLLSTHKRPVELQKKNLGFCYTDISAELLKLWGIPDDISQIVAATHATDREATTPEQKILQLSYVLALNNVYADFYVKHDGVTPNMYEDLGLQIECVDNALDFSNLQLMSAMAIFSPSSFAMF
ncbi:HDOD domain-containing protein [Paraglaciecola aquimarina]|uniref:HDOD domain-containing protein n=1 Tax=Paraglaciecola algarum TaxID=3050085 RepID=A0ABS9DD90_9ALTE|nr:HDOD domain-containing protein [Paraglaciecola sp. G1-23]MCF2949958.1 HDOD domain-containing protein [Paraglaciecola sp. G1-23]